MNGSPGSVSADAEPVLVCGLNWVGDSIMSMPAVLAFRRQNPGVSIFMLVKPGLAPLWRMHEAPQRVISLAPGAGGAWRAAAGVRALGCRRAYVLPHSFRSALVPFLARVPERHGLPGHHRDFMLTRVVAPRNRPGREHQGFEYLDLLAPGAANSALADPELQVGTSGREQAASLLPDAASDTWIGLCPGAARGPSKQWPADHFIELGKMLAGDGVARVALIGAAGETGLCAQVTAGIGSAAVNLAGKTTFDGWAGVLERCRVVVANDSGSMHLAVALGTPVVALYGVTDPAKTGPLGPARILQHSPDRDRDIARDSKKARFWLASIPPRQVYDAVRRLLNEPPPPSRERES